MKAPPFAFFLTASMMLPVHAGAQSERTIDGPARTLDGIAMAPMRASMVARYASVPAPTAVVTVPRPLRVALLRHLMGAAVTMGAVLSGTHLLLATGARMVVHHDD